MRKVRVWRVVFEQKGILDGSVDVVADKAADAIEIARQAVEQNGKFMFDLMGVAAIMAEDKITPLMILWEDTPSSEIKPSEVAVEHDGKQYAAGAMMPREEIEEDSPGDTTPRDPINTDAEKEAAKLISEARTEMQARADAKNKKK